MKRFGPIGVALMILVAACGGGSTTPAGSNTPIVVGFAIAQSGFAQPFDVPASVMAQLGIDDLNAKGGLLGHPLKAVFADTQSEISKGANAALQVMDQGAQFVVVTCDFDLGGAAARTAQSKELIVFSPCAASPKFGVQGIGPWAFTMSNGVNTQAATLAEWAYKTKAWRNPYILVDSVIGYNVEFGNYFKTSWAKLSGSDKIAGQDTFLNGDPSIATQITRLKAISPAPDVIVLSSFPPGGPNALRQIRAAGITAPVISGPPMDGNYWAGSVPNLTDFYDVSESSVFGDSPDAKINELVNRYTTKVGNPPATGDSLTGYAVIQALAAAAQQANSIDNKAMLNALNHFSKVPTILGPTSYSSTVHYAEGRGMDIMKITNGKDVFVIKVTPAYVPPPAF